MRFTGKQGTKRQSHFAPAWADHGVVRVWFQGTSGDPFQEVAWVKPAEGYHEGDHQVWITMAADGSKWRTSLSALFLTKTWF